jgi:hypothetical protein
MPPYRLNHILNELLGYAEDLDHITHENHIEGILTYTTDSGEEYTLTGHRLGTGERVYVVGGHPDLRYVIVAYLYGVPSYVEAFLSENQAETILEGSQVDLGDYERKTRAAARILLSDVDSLEAEEVLNYIRIFAENSNIELDVSDGDPSPFGLLSARSLIFPYDQSFSISDYYNTVRPVVTNGSTAQYLLERALVVEIDEEEPLNSKIEVQL